MKNNYNILGKNYHLEKVNNIYDELSGLDFTKKVSDEVTRLDEDLLQLVFNDKLIIDVGWYPPFDENGEFIIQMIQNSNWENPSVTISSGWDKNELIEKLNKVLGQLPFILKAE
ncbi:hypothetical protein [Citrobacter portucalensis]|uniref:hypothetical protein n=1 Tax=Citrobacter portucalensis TaxID=1639133 RepID=UPI001F152A82|nr:hypothetical protein [Citrobacter portucalensis]